MLSVMPLPISVLTGSPKALAIRSAVSSDRVLLLRIDYVERRFSLSGRERKVRA